MEEKKEFKLFREKSLEAVESPESLNDYLRVTSPGVWLVLAAVIAVLIGGIIWGIVGRIDTTRSFAVAASGGNCVCYVPYADVEKVLARGVVTVNGEEYALSADADCEVAMITEETNPYIRLTGGLNIGDLALEVPVAAELADGVYSGSVITETLQPISLLLQ